MRVKLPYPVKFLGLTFALKRWVGFEFTNRAYFEFREKENVKDSEDLKKWLLSNGDGGFYKAILYGAAIAYCKEKRIKDNFTEDGLLMAVALAPDEIKDKISKAYNESVDFNKMKAGKMDLKKKMKS